MNRNFILFALAFAAALSGFAKTFDVDISTGRPAASNEAYYHGETIEFRAVRGRSVVTNVEYSCVYYQTNGMDDVWWKTDGLVFHPSNDVGAASYRFFMEGRDEIGRDWHANGLLRLLDSPGFEPNVIELPVARLDFANMEVLNAPYYTKNETDELLAAATPDDYETVKEQVATNAADIARQSGQISILQSGKANKSALTAEEIRAKNAEQGLAENIADSYSEIYARVPNTRTVNGHSLSNDVTLSASDVGAVPASGISGAGALNLIIADGSGGLMDSRFSALDVASATSVARQMAAATNSLAEVAHSGSYDDLSNTPSIPSSAADVGAYPATDGAQLSAQVSALGATLAGEDARFVSTNYDSVVHIPEAYLEIKVSNNWLTVWQEMRRWNAFAGLDFVWENWNGFYAWYTNIEHEVASKADRAWGAYDSETGGFSPEGYTQISSSNILIAAGMAYQRTITSGGAVWVLQCNQGTAHIGGDTNGFFRVVDGDGVTQFEIVKGDKRELGADADGITVSGDVVTIPYSIEAEEPPVLQICDDLRTADWKPETDQDCIATVSWSGVSGAYVATVQRKTPGTSLFVKATYMAGGETYIRNAAPVSMDSIIINGTKYYIGTAAISGHTVLTLSTTAP